MGQKDERPARDREEHDDMRLLDRLEEMLIAFLIAAATLIIFVAVVHRYATGVPFL